MQFVPWRNIADWHCKACGYCCKLYSVVLNFHEWLRLTKTYGVETTISGLDRFFIKRVDDGSCTFLCHDSNSHFCGLQNIKPEACKIWPFKVLTEPKYGEENLAAYDYRGLRFYVYGDDMCSGLRYGTPTWDFQHTDHQGIRGNSVRRQGRTVQNHSSSLLQTPTAVGQKTISLGLLANFGD